MQSSDCRTSIIKYQIETCLTILEITIKSQMNQMKNVSPNIREKKNCASAGNIWSVAIFRVHIFLFMAPQTQLPSFISYWSLHKNIISSLHMIEASVQAARSKRNNFFQIILERGIFWISDRSFNHTWCRQLCAAAHLCTLIKLKYFPTFFVS